MQSAAAIKNPSDEELNLALTDFKAGRVTISQLLETLNINPNDLAYPFLSLEVFLETYESMSDTSREDILIERIWKHPRKNGGAKAASQNPGDIDELERKASIAAQTGDFARAYALRGEVIAALKRTRENKSV
jgi:hypothetical protein